MSHVEPPIHFCSHCGHTVERRIPTGEDRERYVCPSCSTVHYQNPRMVVGCIIEHEGRLLICKRAIEPRYGFWTIPAGFMELGESAAQGAVRETFEEADARVEVIAPYAHFDIPYIGQAYIFYRARMLDPKHGAGSESLETRLALPDEIPWDDMAFAVVRVALKLYIEDMQSGVYRMHDGALHRDEKGYQLIGHVAHRFG
jgi:ADP-ribose/FAD diphosphatase